MKIKIKLTETAAKLPYHATDGSAGYDLYATRIITETTTQIRYGTGVAVEIPKGYCGLIFPRSSICNRGLQLSNCVGVIDSDYRGEITAVFNLQYPYQIYEVGERIAQMVVVPCETLDFEVVNELEETKRGIGGYGSTGKK